VIAWGDMRDTFADLEHLAGSLMTEYGGSHLREDAAHRGQVGVTHTRRVDLDPDQTRTDVDSADIVSDLEFGVTDCVEDGGAHGRSPQAQRPTLLGLSPVDGL
jgi:hypothetical protein